MRGGEGTGKGTVARVLMRIFGHHSLQISNPKHLTGNFNLHLRDCIALFADEAFFAGDKAHVGVLKSIITEPYLTIEGKYQNAIQVPNFLHLIMASNENWVIPASLDARRFLVLDVGIEAKDNHEYFEALWQEMENGGYEAFLYDLLHYDLTHFNVRRPPETEGLREQKKLSLPTLEAWWLDVLQRGYVFRSKLGLEKEFGVWHEEIATELLFTSYLEFATARRERYPATREAIGKFMLRLDCEKKLLYKVSVGEHIVETTNQYGGSTRVAQPVKATRPWGYRIGPRDLAREAFNEVTGLAIDWTGVGNDDEPPRAYDELIAALNKSWSDMTADDRRRFQAEVLNRLTL
ncbi:MAG: hypothetical protein JO110_03610 [Acetobacteraceae bacterium]|nr:hypothetical protein [Acetobacteraceae bacterium]